MLIADTGGSSPVATTPPPPVHDTKVDEAVSNTLKAADFGPEPEHAVAYQISQVLADKDLTQAEKDEYVARMVELTHSPGWSKMDNGKTIPDVVRGAFEDIGTAWSGAETKELRDQVTAAIGRGANSLRLDADDLYGLVDPAKNPYSDGARQLLTTVADGKSLNTVASRLLDAAKAEGYDINKYQDGPAILVAAGDIANRAALFGNTASANAIVREIGRVEQNGPVAGDMTLMKAMMATTATGPYSGFVAPGRNGFDVLSGLINSADSYKSDIQTTTDSMFATLTRAGYTGKENADGLGQLGQYFNLNLSRLNENGWRYDSSGDVRENLVQDFVSKIMLDDDYPLKDWTTSTISTELDRLAGQVQDGSLSAKDRAAAATGLGELVGSLKGGANDYFENAHASDDAKISAIRFFSDQLTGKLSSAAGPFGKLVDMGVDAGWGAVSDKLDDGINDKVKDALGDLQDQSNSIRRALGTMGDPDLINDYDQRYVEHVPD